ncbi:hypothetical protein BCR43DRAFT_442045 [Syncephalastrum racemosum]|uniref:CBS domain-containing protein n=1 Tax=Syncephalastrum racemosum TaxID=13706 RepID=A0A1X2H7F8_SYNRA|nr:hypothetical protein BCR43DRAFT_442045 [Syncephalastrum racemosum]
MAAKRSDCVLVVDDDEHLSGIFTAKDLAYRVVASHLDARTTAVSAIMTRGPMCVTADTSAQDALNLMVSRGFRHLPVCNEEGNIFGLLDITKCLYEALNKMERAYGSSRKLYDALEGVEREWTQNNSGQFVQYMEALREKMSCPDLTTILDTAEHPVQVSVKTNVREISKLMKEYHTTAVLVMDRHDLVGIFTSKDIVLRVIAAGLAPETCSVVRVMTPHPDTATPSTSILEALKKMHDGHYLNLPVLDEGRNITGLVDVLRLTYATLEQINGIDGSNGEADGGSKFWNSIATVNDNGAESDSVVSEPHTIKQRSPITPQPTDESTLLNHSSGSSTTTDDAQSSISSAIGTSFSFKFTFSQKTHRFRCDYHNYAVLREIICGKVGLPNDRLAISYKDDEDDEVEMTCGADLLDAVQVAQKLRLDRIKLVIKDTHVVEAREDCLPKGQEDLPRRENRGLGWSISADMVLPTAITFLGVVILGAFILGRR